MEALRPHLEAKRHIIWDWNGTLLDDLEACIEAIGVQLEEHGLPRVGPERYRELFRFPIRDYYRDLGFDYGRVPFETLSERFMSLYDESLPRCELHPGVRELLTELRASGRSLSVLSAAQETSLLRQLERFGVRHHFDRVYGLSDHYAVSKVERGRALLAECGYAPEDSILVGDTDHDLEVGRALGVDVLLVSDGHQSFERLSRAHDRVLRSRRELV